jgi:putative polyhydroxyalkanoate system protein
VPDIHIHRDHGLGLKAARTMASSWAEKVQKKFDMECVYEEGDTEDLLRFSRAGVQGTVRVDAQQLEMTAQLGFLFAAFKDRIESEIGKQLDALLSQHVPAKAPAKPAAKAAAKPSTPGAGRDRKA